LSAKALGSEFGPLARWRYAVKPASWPKLLVPCALGQAMGLAHSGSLRADGLLLGAGFTVAGLLFIVLLNDWGDREIDALKRRLFPDDCSPKTIPDAILGAGALLWAGSAAGALALCCAWLGGHYLGRPLLGPAAVLGLAVFWAYSLPPLRLNYRGGGELLEMFGVGLLLPWLNAYLQTGAVFYSALWPLPGFALLSLASALASTLSDEVSDRQGGKTTLATRSGNAVVRRAVEWLGPLGLFSYLPGAWLAGGAGLLLLSLPAVILGALHYRALRVESPAAVTLGFAAQGRYKLHLHRLIWHSGLWVALASVVGAALP